MDCDFLKLAAERYSVRKFADKKLDRDVIGRILQAGMLAPTACNRQPQRILVIDDDEALARLRKCTECHFHAPAALLVCYDRNACWRRAFDGKTSGDIDASIVATHMMLAAQSLGVGTTWVMYFVPEAIREELQVPDTLELVALLMMGYPAPDAKPAPAHAESKRMDEIVFYNRF